MGGRKEAWVLFQMASFLRVSLQRNLVSLLNMLTGFWKNVLVLLLLNSVYIKLKLVGCVLFVNDLPRYQLRSLDNCIALDPEN